MVSKRALEGELAAVKGFADPAVELEQYATPAKLAATLVHLADLQGDLDRTVIDLGAGTGILAIGAALRGAPRVVGLERDRDALETAKENAAALGVAESIEWVQADATRPPLADGEYTVVMNPPFGAQRGHEHADRTFLERVADLAIVSYSVHNDGSWEFVEPFSVDHGGLATHAYQATIELERQFPFHEDDSRTQAVEVFRIEWNQSRPR